MRSSDWDTITNGTKSGHTKSLVRGQARETKTKEGHLRALQQYIWPDGLGVCQVQG